MKQISLLFLSLLFCVMLKAETTPATSYAGGSGTSADPYQIATLAQLRLLSETSADWAKIFILTADIDAADTKTWNSGAGFSPIGDVASTGYRQKVPFTGVFDGNNHVISNLYINREEQLLGLFGRVESGAEIKNTGLVNVNITGSTDVVNNVGALVGYAQGNNGQIKVSNCFAAGGNINGYNTIGGLIGTVNNVTIANCYATVNVSGYTRVGGLAGRVAASGANFTHCYATGKCSGTEKVKGFYGSVEAYPTITSCYWDTITSEMPDECYNITPVSTTDFSNESTFSGWDFSSDWKILALSSADSVKRPHFTWAYDHLVSFELGTNGDSIIGADIQGVTDKTDAFAIKAVGNVGYIIKKWQNATGDSITNENPLTVTNVTQDSTLYAIFQPGYKVVFSSAGNGTIEGVTYQEVTSGNNTSGVKALPDEHYRFDEWRNAAGDSITNENPLIVTGVTQDSSLIAIFEINNHTVSFSADGNGTISGESTQEVESGSNSTVVSAIPNTGYNFIKWQNTDGSIYSTNNPLVISDVQNNVSLQAIFKATATDKIVSIPPLKDAYINYNKGIPDRADKNYNEYPNLILFCQSNFKNYCQTLVSFSELDVPIAAIKNVSLKLYNNGKNNIGNNQFNVYWFTEEWEETEVTWNNAPALDINAPHVTMPTNVVKKQDFSIDVTDIFISNYQASVGEAGFRLKHVDYNNDKELYLASKENTTYNTPSLNLYINEGYYSVQFLADNNGSISGKTTQIVAQSSNTSSVTAVPNTGYHFIKWQDVNSTTISTDNPLTINNVTQDSTLTAVFEADNHTISFSADENGTVSGETTQTVAYSSDATKVTATAVTAGYGFVEWQDQKGNIVSIQNPLTVTYVTQDSTLKAIFAKKYEDGIGSSDNPYKIATLEQLKNLSEASGDWTRSFILTANIDATETRTWNISGTDTLGFSPIGDIASASGNRQQVPFTGVFDGNNHIISNLYINRPEQLLGLFGRIEAGAEIKNTGLVNVNIKGTGGNVGALVGYAQGSNGKITISNCFAVGGTVVTEYNSAGGLLGTLNYVDLNNSYAIVDVEAPERVGGFVGRVGASKCSFTNCYAAGKVSGGTTNIGGFFGRRESTPSVTSCYWDAETSGQSDGGYYGTTGLTSAQFSDASSFSNWDFESNWKVLALANIDSVMRPNLQWAYDHVVSFELGTYGDTIIGANIQGVTNDSSALEVTAVPNTGCTFDEWRNTAGDSITNKNPLTINPVTQDWHLTAVFKINTYAVTFLDWDNTQLSQQTIEYGKAATAPSNTTRTGYTFAGWDVDFSNITSDLTVIAQYTKNGVNNYTVTFKDWDGTVLSSQTVAENSAATAPTEPSRTGYTFTGWDTDFSNVTSNLTVIAQYTQNGVINYTVTFTTDGNGTISGNTKQTVNSGANATAVTAVPSTGYRFVKWQDDKGTTISTDNPFTITNVTSDMAIHAVFEITTNIENKETESSINVYPNPTSGLVNIFTEKNDVKLELYNTTGKLVYSALSFKGGVIDLSNMERGIYIVKITTGEKISIAKLIKK